MSYDSTSDARKEERFLRKYKPLLKKLQKQVHFDLKELELISIIYFKIQQESEDNLEWISRDQFRHIFYTAFNMFDDQIIKRIFVGLDKGITPYVTLETWIKTLSLFLRGTLDEKIKYCFICYDYLGQGLITYQFIKQYLKNTLIKGKREDIDDLIDLVLQKMDPMIMMVIYHMKIIGILLKKIQDY